MLNIFLTISGAANVLPLVLYLQQRSTTKFWYESWVKDLKARYKDAEDAAEWLARERRKLRRW